MSEELADLGAAEAAALIAERKLDAEELARACLERIAAREGEVGAFIHFDPELALAQARERDTESRSGLPTGPLHGVPVAVKDIFDTRDWPTENGSVLDRGRQPRQDCAAVARLRAAGAVILGKTVTTEFAVFGPGKTRNPHNPEHTPGGSSSGSAAAVAAGMAPLAIGSQTNGSIIRPASFCGVVGFKPTHGAIPRTGALLLSRVLDHVGVFARSVDDVALLGDALFGHDAGDPDTQPRASAKLAEIAAEEPPATPSLGFTPTAVWDQAEADTQAGFAELVETLGDDCGEVELPQPFEATIELHRTIMLADLAKYLGGYYARGKDQLSDRLREMIEAGQQVRAVDYNRAVDWMAVLNAGLDEVFANFDALVMPAAPGTAPRGLEATGNPVFCTLATYCGVPAVSLPLLSGENGLPIGVQLIGPRGGDARLLRTANWLLRRLAADSTET